VFLLSLALVSCGGSGKTSLDPENPITEQGDFKSISGKTSNKKVLIQAALRKIEGLNLAPQYDVTTYKLNYLSRDSDNQLVTVSGLIAVPDKNTPSPLLSFQHGTTFIETEAPSYHLAVDTRHPEILFASLGYIVFSPDYIGYGSSKDETHPYLQRQPSADIVIDMLAAGKTWLDKENIITTQQIFLTGYSEGGYVTMAALEALQKKTGSANFTVTGAVLGAGPYDLYEALNTLLYRLSSLPEFLGDAAQEVLEYFLLPKNAEVYFERTFLDRYFDKNKQDNVHNWQPSIPLKLFHGKDDDIVPIESAISTWQAMVSLGADVELVQCTATSANHSRCVIPYLNYTINYFAGLRQDL
jgi:dipeptidyl aminopeptidase/acylaminoacyl peptidase